MVQVEKQTTTMRRRKKNEKRATISLVLTFSTLHFPTRMLFSNFVPNDDVDDDDHALDSMALLLV